MCCRKITFCGTLEEMIFNIIITYCADDASVSHDVRLDKRVQETQVLQVSTSLLCLIMRHVGPSIFSRVCGKEATSFPRPCIVQSEAHCR